MIKDTLVVSSPPEIVDELKQLIVKLDSNEIKVYSVTTERDPINNGLTVVIRLKEI